MTPEQFKARVKEVIGDKPAKVWLIRTTGHRLDFVWSVGPAQLTQEETLAQGGKYHLVGQNITDELADALIPLFEEFYESDYVINDKTVDRKIRLIFRD